MKIVKNIFIFLGILFVVFIIFTSFLSIRGNSFKEENLDFISEFLDTFSQSWEISSVTDQLSNEFLLQIKTPNGEHAMQFFKQLGYLENVRDFELGNYSASTTTGETGVIVFKAKFKNADTIVKVTLNVIDDLKKVHGLNIQPLGDINYDDSDKETST